MVAHFKTFLFFAFSVFLLFDTVFCTCQLTPQFKVPDEKNRISFERDARELFKQYWPEWFDESKYNRDEINQKMDELGQDFYKRKSQGIYRSDAKKCELREIDISFKDFMLITPKCEEMKLRTVTVIYGDGSVVPLEKLVEAVPHLTSFFYYIPEEDADVAKIVTSTTVENLLQIPLFSTLKNFTLFEVPESFDIQRFFAYIKENKTIHVELGYDSEVSKEFATNAEAIIQEIIHTKDRDYDVPWFYFSAMDGDLYDGLLAICNRCG